MKVLVTGATSGLGRNAVEYLRNKGISVRATGRNEAMGKLLSKMGAEFIPADLTELVSSQAKVMLAGIDTLWHCSSFTSPWGTQQAFDNNINGLLNDFCGADAPQLRFEVGAKPASSRKTAAGAFALDNI